MVMLFYPCLNEIGVAHIGREQKQKWPILHFQAFSLDELLFTVQQPEESQELV